MSIPSLRKSKISRFVPMMSNDEVIKQLLTPVNNNDPKKQTAKALNSRLFSESNLEEIKTIVSQTNFDKPKFQSVLNNLVSSVLVTTFHSLSIDISFTSEIIQHICQEVRTEIKRNEISLGIKNDNNKIKSLQIVILNQIGEYVKIIHEDYKISLNKEIVENKPPTDNEYTYLSDTNFCIKKYHNIKKENKSKLYHHKSQFGLLGHTTKKNKKKLKEPALNEEIVVPRNGLPKRSTVFNTAEIINYKLKKQSDQTDSDISKFLNQVDDSGKLKIRDDKSCSVSFMMMNNPRMRVGTKNSLELSTFLNSLSTIELSKCLPYLDVKFILPRNIETKSEKIFQTSSITQFLDGTPISASDALTSPFYKTLSTNFVRDAGNNRLQRAVETNLSAFTMPQTINNFDELYVGHLSSYAKGEKGNTINHSLFKRNNTIHDYTKPFLTIKSFNIDVAPTQGLMSFKTGRLSLVLHDKSRMSEVAPFIKPDLFGSFGAEIAIQYGWSHMDAIKNPKPSDKVNYFAQFLEENKIYEKYIITNSSYNIDKNGQVNIDLAIAMKGPVSIRAINFESNTPQKIDKDYLDGLSTRLKDQEEELIQESNKSIEKNTLSRITSVRPSDFFENIADAIVKEFSHNSDPKKNARPMRTVDAVREANSTAQRKKIRNAKNDQQKIAEIGKFFNAIFKNKNYYVKIKTESNEDIDLADVTAENFNPTDLTNYRRMFVRLYSRTVRLANNAQSKVSGERKKLTEEIEGLLQKLTDGLSIEDPFFDLENIHNVEQISNDKLKTIKTNKNDGIEKPKYDLSKPQGKESVLIYPSSIKGTDSFDGGSHSSLTDYVSLGNIILAVLGSHLAFTRGYDEIQIVSYTLNNNAGLAMNKNVASLLINKEELTSFLFDLFKNGAQYTLESLLTQIIKKFIVTRYCVNYGMRDFYKIDSNSQVSVKDEKKKPDELKKDIDERLEKIHNLMYKGSDDDSFLTEIKFVMPKIKLLFDTITTKRSGGNDTILRISLFDRNDNPFNSINSIMNKVYDRGIQDAVRDINKRLIELKALKKKEAEYSKQKQKFNDENKKLIQKLIDAKFLKYEDGQYVILGRPDNAFSTLKEQLKSFMPAINYGSSNSAVIDASISTINEAKLNTVYMTRPDRNDNTVKTRVRYKQDLPLRILPSQANITMFGCPFVNFAQYIFLDFETNTTIDNQYAVTGIKHEMTPGKFTTSLTLAYGDAFGKYETVVDTLTRTVNEDADRKRTKSKKNLQDAFYYDDEKNKNNISKLGIDQKGKTIDRITDVNLKSLGDGFQLQIKYPKLGEAYLNVHDVRVVNKQENFQPFYRLDHLMSNDKLFINLHDLILCLPVDLTSRKKEIYIDIKDKVFANYKINYFPKLSILKFIELFKNNNKIFKETEDPEKFFEWFVNNNMDFFKVAIKLYITPILKITVPEAKNYKELFINKEGKSGGIDFRFVNYSDCGSEIREKIIRSYRDELNLKFKTEINIKHEKTKKEAAANNRKNRSKRPRPKREKAYKYAINSVKFDLNSTDFILTIKGKNIHKKEFQKKLDLKKVLEDFSQFNTFVIEQKD